MLTLYYAPGVCSLAPHIVIHELGLEYKAVKVNLRTKQTEHGEDFDSIATKSSVPLLMLENGESLTETAAMLQYLADLKPSAKLAPDASTFERVRLQEWLNYIATELHKTHWPLFFKDQAGQQAYNVYLEKLKKSYSYIQSKLDNQSFLMGDHFTIADAYCFTVINWHKTLKLDLSPWPGLADYQQRVQQREKVQSAMKAEGLKA